MFDKYQKISYISDKIRKKCKNFFIVQERNKTDNSAHYHLIIQRMPKDFNPPKGVNWHCQKIGGEVEHYPDIINHIPDKTENVLYRQLAGELGEYHHLLTPTVCLLTTIFEKQIKASRGEKQKMRKIQKRDHIARVLNYMAKEIEFIEYNTYVQSFNPK